MLKDILILIIGLIWGTGLGVALSSYLIEEDRKKKNESVMRVIVDIEELKKQMKEDNQ